MLNSILIETVKAPAIDINVTAQFNGESLLDLDLDGLEEQPWRKPGADITDYFNYGFNEVTWRAYCNKQKSMREDLKKSKGGNHMDQQNGKHSFIYYLNF
jgi:pre-mRNA 3'-end-processing factor FIP1